MTKPAKHIKLQFAEVFEYFVLSGLLLLKDRILNREAFLCMIQKSPAQFELGRAFENYFYPNYIKLE